MVQYNRNALLEIRLIGGRKTRVLVGEVVVLIVVLHILGADTFIPRLIRVAAIRNRRRPRHGEDAWILHREFELEALAPVIGIDTADAGPFLLGAFQRFLGSLVIEETI